MFVMLGKRFVFTTGFPAASWYVFPLGPYLPHSCQLLRRVWVGGWVRGCQPRGAWIRRALAEKPPTLLPAPGTLLRANREKTHSSRPTVM